jgi:hypothetical protein
MGNGSLPQGQSRRGLRRELLFALCLVLAPGCCVGPVISGAKKHLLLPDVAPTLANAKNAGVANPGARPLAELNDRQKTGTTMAGVTQIGTSEHGVTVHLTAELSTTKANVYALAGMSGVTRDGREKFLSLPAAFQVATPFGADIGGVSPAFFSVKADARFDSWLTVGVTDGSAAGALATSPGLGLDRWSADAPFTTRDGAVSIPLYESSALLQKSRRSPDSVSRANILSVASSRALARSTDMSCAMFTHWCVCVHAGVLDGTRPWTKESYSCGCTNHWSHVWLRSGSLARA